MKRLICLAAGCLLCAGLNCAAQPEAEPVLPNIVFILADDLGYGDLGCFGAADIKTPHIDRICEEGMKFTDFHVHPRCSPTRAAFLTGSYANRTGVSRVIYLEDTFGLNDDEMTIPELLKTAGCRTGMVGKWHVGSREPFFPQHHGFDYSFMKTEMIDRERFEKDGFIVQPNGKKKYPAVDSYLENGTLYGTVAEMPEKTKLYTEHAVQFIAENKDRPFFLYFAHNLPHIPLEPSEAFRGTSGRGQYGDCVQELDWSVGEVLKTLDELNLTENTLVIFCSDNGPQLQYQAEVTGGSAGPLRDGKWSSFEGGTRTPFIARWPKKIQPGTECSDLIGIIDMLPTFCALTGAKVPADRVIDGVDISASLFGESKDHPPRETFACFDGGGCYAFRYRQWKLFIRDEESSGTNAQGVKTGPVKAGSLFDMAGDAAETRDVSAEHPEFVEQIQKMAEQFLAEFKATVRDAGRME
ncbi:MAG: sulfatase [Pontiellaceae bacterium]|nr:sulfatase [Pontiellaceae bacterium]